MWQLDDPGLWLPRTPEEVSPDEEVASSRRQSHDWTAVVQALATLFAAVVALLGIWIGVRTLHEQQAINKSQGTVDQIAQDRFEHRYVSRVAWWQTEIAGGSSDIYLVLENRSVVPIQGILVVPANGDGKLVTIRDLTPCTRVQVKIPPYKFTKLKNGAEYSSWFTQTVFFSDPAGSWREDYALPATRGTYSDPVHSPAASGFDTTTSLWTTSTNGLGGNGLEESRQQVTDCGDSG